MSESADLKLSEKVKYYIIKIEKCQDKIQHIKKLIEEKQENIEKEVLNIVSNRSLSTQERTERMIPLMEKQDQLKEFVEEIEVLVDSKLVDKVI